MTETPTADRQRELAQHGAFDLHDAYFNRGVSTLLPHMQPFDTCPHPDCQLVQEARAPLAPLERYDAGHERFQREQIRGLTQTVAALLRQLHRLGCVGCVPSFDVDPEEWASAYDPQTNDTLLHLTSEARAPRPQPVEQNYESRSLDDDRPKDAGISSRGRRSGRAEHGLEPADSHSTTAAAPLGGPPAGWSQPRIVTWSDLGARAIFPLVTDKEPT